MKTDFSDETLMRFADGELDEETAAALDRALAHDEDLAARLAVFIDTRSMLKAALQPLRDEPVPAKLVAAVQAMVDDSKRRTAEPSVSNNIVSMRPRRDRPARPSRWMLPLAASLAAFAGGLGGYWLAASAVQEGLRVAGINSPALDDALASVASGGEIEMPDSGQRFRAIATFRDDSKTLCREFEVDSADRSTVISVACRAGTEWNVRFAVVAPGDPSGYAPASSTEALDAYLAAIDAAPPMSPEDEKQALAEAK
jgi:anti-sigma factor RsiW